MFHIKACRKLVAVTDSCCRSCSLMGHYLQHFTPWQTTPGHVDPMQLKSMPDYTFSWCRKVFSIFQHLSAIAVEKKKKKIQKSLAFLLGYFWCNFHLKQLQQFHSSFKKCFHQWTLFEQVKKAVISNLYDVLHPPTQKASHFSRNPVTIFPASCRTELYLLYTRKLNWGPKDKCRSNFLLSG